MRPADQQYSRDGGTDLARNVLGVPGIVSLVLAAVALLTGTVVIAGIGIAVGNGGMPAAFIAATAVLLLFAVGYAQMSKRMPNAGGFYAFVVEGLGRPPGLVTGFVAMLGYNCFVAGAIGTSGFFTTTAANEVFGGGPALDRVEPRLRRHRVRPEQTRNRVQRDRARRAPRECLAGPEKGLADTDEHTSYEIRPGIDLFAWREKVVPCASVTVADHHHPHRMRSHGALFGLDETGTLPVQFTFGAYGRLLSNTVHPHDVDPAH
ncbi:MoaF C-terminal domain-containing protein [Salinifilum ghardaiensis]